MIRNQDMGLGGLGGPFPRGRQYRERQDQVFQEMQLALFIILSDLDQRIPYFS